MAIGVHVEYTDSVHEVDGHYGVLIFVRHRVREKI